MKRLFLPALLAFPIWTITADDLDQSLDSEESAQTATAITIIFDNSGSMADKGKLKQAKNAFTAWLDTLPPEYSLALIDFKTGKARLAVPLGAENRQAVRDHVAKVTAYGKTPICDCLKIAQSQIAERRTKHSPYERHVVIVFTDGKETVDRRGDRGVMEEIMKLRNAVVEVVGIGFHGQGDYMRPAATRYYHASDEEELASGLAKVDAEIGDDADIEITQSDMDMIEKTKIPLPPAPGGGKQ
ncbi:MAG: VWA domain-containing protein [Verrucomicrobiales bacterium]|nr:VWA domain-containing protein [Verrucomicrobiales bacterium]